MSPTVLQGQFTVCITERPIEETAFELSSQLTADGEPLLILDAAGCFEPSRMSPATPGLARHLHILRAASSSELEEICSGLLSAQLHVQSRRALVVGLLNHLYDPQMLTRDAARALGRIKSQLWTLVESGLEVVVCETGNGNPGTRAHFLPSLCASAHQVLEYRDHAISVS